MSARLILLCTLAALPAAAEESRRPPMPAVLDAVLSGGRLTESLEFLAERAPLASGVDLRVVEVGRDARSSHHVVSIRTAEEPHRHDRHDLLVVMVRGEGSLRIGNEARAVGEGSILWIPRGTAHAFTNRSDAPAVAYAVYLPPFDGEDRVPAE